STSPAAACLAVHLVHILLLLLFGGSRRRCVEAPALRSAVRRARAEEEARGSGPAGRPEARGRRRADRSPPPARPRHRRPPGSSARAHGLGFCTRTLWLCPWKPFEGPGAATCSGKAFGETLTPSKGSLSPCLALGSGQFGSGRCLLQDVEQVAWEETPRAFR
uniref:Uncharacterized protein n=1 Tax=Lynx canadensis TaxID=61383 RepID=A0A667G4B0_LYNCA